MEKIKILVVPDVHGIGGWEEPVKEALKEGVHVVFIGDYVDSPTVSLHDILKNLERIVAFKRSNPGGTTLLLGNHDYAYVFGKTRTTGFDAAMWHQYRQTFHENWDLFDIAWGHGESRYTLFTHAGLTSFFYQEMEKEILAPKTSMHAILGATEGWRSLPLHELMNHFKDKVGLMWMVGLHRRGMDVTGSPLWADRQELLDDPYEGIDQIVGHTPVATLEIHETTAGRIIFTDVHRDESLTCTYVELI